MCDSPFARIYTLARQIPRGRVTNYGTLARLCGNPRWARVVGYAMRGCQDPTVPCHRVVKQDGSLSFPGQKELLEAEGVPFTPEGKVRMICCRWPSPIQD